MGLQESAGEFALAAAAAVQISCCVGVVGALQAAIVGCTEAT